MFKKGECMKEDLTPVLIPKGAWLKPILSAFESAGIQLNSKKGSDEYTLVDGVLPIILYAVDAKQVGSTAGDWDTTVFAGFAPTDALAEERTNLSNPRLWELPIFDLYPDSPNQSVYLGLTPNIRQRESEPSIWDLDGTTIYTPYPSLAMLYLCQQIEIKIKVVNEQPETFWRLNPRNGGVVSLMNSPEQLISNQITLIEELFRVGIYYVEGALMPQRDQLRVDDLREKFYQALQSKRLQT